MTIPEKFHPRGPEPSDPRIEAAARVICEALAADRTDRPDLEERAINLHDACSGFPRFGHVSAIPTNDFRWAVKRMVEAGLLECIEVEPPPPIEDEIFERKPSKDSPEFKLVSKPCLWTKWRVDAPLLSAPLKAGPRILCEESDRSVYLDGKRLVDEVELPLFGFFRAIASVYPDPISYQKIKERVPGLHGKHSTRDLKNRLPPPLLALVQSGKHGYFLRLPHRK